MTPSIAAIALPASTRHAVTGVRRWNGTQLLILLALTLAGCSRFDTQYGASEGAAGTESLNGFAAFRFELQEAPLADGSQVLTHDVVRLSSREARSDAFVWIPVAWPPSNLLEIENWLDQWLAQNHRTLIFIVPDDGSTEAYFREVATIAPPQQRLNYRRQLAKLINERSLAEAQRSDVSLGHWFTAAALPYRAALPDRQHTDFSLQQSKVIAVTPNQNTASSRLSAKQQSAGTQTANAEIEDVRFEPLERVTTTLPTGSASLTTLARITSDRWKKSQVVVVSSGSLVTNFAMTGTAARKLVDRIRDEIRLASDAGPDQTIDVAFLSSGHRPIPISEAKPGIPRTRGWELMTEMPLSLINLHVAFLGIVLCLMLLPVFGRPRSVRYNHPTHFGNHLSAMATLMRRSGGTNYAKEKISQYLRQVRGETSGPWVLPPPGSSESELPRETQP